jgi:hypothetical protein
MQTSGLLYHLTNQFGVLAITEFAPNSGCRQRCGTVTFHPL